MTSRHSCVTFFMFFEGIHPQIAEMPGRAELLPIPRFASSDRRAHVAGALGLPCSFAHHFAAHTKSPGSRSTGRVLSRSQAPVPVRNDRRAGHRRDAGRIPGRTERTFDGPPPGGGRPTRPPTSEDAAEDVCTDGARGRTGLDPPLCVVSQNPDQHSSGRPQPVSRRTSG